MTLTIRLLKGLIVNLNSLIYITSVIIKKTAPYMYIHLKEMLKIIIKLV